MFYPHLNSTFYQSSYQNSFVNTSIYLKKLLNILNIVQTTFLKASHSPYSISIFWMKKKAYPRKKCVLTDWVTLLAVLLKQREIFTSFTGKGQIQLAIPPPCIKRQKYFPLLSPPKSREHHGTKHLLDIFGEMLSQV